MRIWEPRPKAGKFAPGMRTSLRDILVAHKCDGGRLRHTMVRRILPFVLFLGLAAACATSPLEGDDKQDSGEGTSSSTSTSSTSSSSGGSDGGKDTGASSSSGGQDAKADISTIPDTSIVVDTGPGPAAACVGADAVFTNIIAIFLLTPKSCSSCNAQTECCFKNLLNQTYCIDENLIP